MKLALNGALTIGTLDGANIEIRDAVGDENLYIFGLRAEEIADLRARGAYDPRECRHGERTAARVLEALASERFAGGEPGVFAPMLQSLLDHGDRYFVLADFEHYAATQEQVRPRLSRRRAVVAARRCSTSRGWATSRPIAPSASTPIGSGVSRRWADPRQRRLLPIALL